MSFTFRSLAGRSGERDFPAMPPDAGEGPDLSFAADLPLTRAAIKFAQERHGDQVRAGDRAPFLVHPLEVASSLSRAGYADPVVAAAVLHDVLEDTDAGREELEGRFGSEVSQLVAVVSDDPEIEDEERRKDEVRERVRRTDGDAAVLYAADKVSKVRELRMLLADGLDRRQADIKLRRYRKSLEMLEQLDPENSLVQELRFELEALDELPPLG